MTYSKKKESKEGIESKLGPILFFLYGICKQSFLRRLIHRWTSKLEKGPFYSVTLRKIFQEYHGIEIGMYSYGCFNPNRINSLTRIGRYCSFAEGVCIFNGNHPLDHLSLHPFFYNPKIGIVEEDNIKRRQIEIGHDVWVGRNAIITPSVNKIGNGAVIGAGSIVTKDVPDFAVVVGNPAKVIRYRFSEKAQIEVCNSKWWLNSIEELKKNLADFTEVLEQSK